jgi:hypothetical protein
MKQITQRLIFCLALLLPALAGYSADITEDFSSNTNSWMPTSASETATDYTSPTTGLVYTFYNSKFNTSYLYVTKNTGYIEVTLPIACSGVEITTPNNSIGKGAGFTITATSTTDDSATSTTIGFMDLTSKNSTITYDFVKDANKTVQPAGTKFKFAAGSGNTQVTKIKFVEYVEQEPSTDPELSVFKESYDFGTVLAGKQSTATSVKLKAANLTEDISVSVDNDAFKLSATSITLAAAANGVDVTFAPTEAKEENYSATLTFTSGELTATTTLTGICPVVTGDGTHDNPFTVADVILLKSALDQSNKYYVKGTISDKCAASAKNGVLGTTEELSTYNILLTDGENNIGVALSSEAIRSALNIKDNPQNVKGTLLVEGTLKDYYSAPGVQNLTSNYELELYVDPSTDPKLSVYKESYDFGAVLAGKESAATSVGLTANNLTEDISVSVDNDVFTLSTTSIALADAANGVDVTFAPIEAREENYSATLTFTSGELTATTTLTGICPVVTGDGTHDNPFTVADVISLNNCFDQSNKYYVKGIISDKCATSAENGLGTTETVSTTNLVLTDGENNIAVELPSGNIRTALNISDHPENINGTLLVEGTLKSYYNAPGVKNTTSNYELELYKEPAAVDHYVIYSADALAENEEQINTGDWQPWYNVANELAEDTTSPEGAAQRLYHGESANNYVMGWTILKENFSATKLFTTTEEGSEAYDVVFMAKSSDASESYYVNLPANGDHFNYFTLPANEWTEIRIHAPEVVSEYWATDPDVFQVGIGANGVSTADNALYFCDLHFEPADHSNDQAWEAGKTFWGIQSGTTPFNGIDYPYYLRYSITTNEDKTLTTTSEWTGLDALGGLVKPQFSVDVANSQELFMNCGENDPVDNVYTFKTSIARDVDQTLLVWYYYPYTGTAIRPENIFYVTCSESEKPELPIQLVITADSKEVTDATAEIHYTVYPAALAENCTVTLEGAGTAVQNDGYFYVSGLDAQTEYSYTLTVSDTTDANAVDGTAAVTFSTQVKDGVDQISADSAAAEYYNLQGIRVTNPVQGQIYIRKQNQKATKVAF